MAAGRRDDRPNPPLGRQDLPFVQRVLTGRNGGTPGQTYSAPPSGTGTASGSSNQRPPEPR